MTNKELNKKMAKIMGWKLYKDPRKRCEPWYEDKQGTRTDESDWHPTESISDAFQVVEKMVKDRTQVDMGNNYIGDDWYCNFGLGFITVAGADTLPLAICLAAKKAFEADN